MGKIKEKVLDAKFSLVIRNRDNWTCQYPGCYFRASPPTNLIQNSHFYTRTARSVRYDPFNCDAICYRHHSFLEQRKNGEYLEWKLRQLGPERFAALRKRYTTLKQWTEREKRELLDGFNEKIKLYK